MVHKDRKTFKIPDDCPYKNNGWNSILCGFCPNYCENDGGKSKVEVRHVD